MFHLAFSHVLSWWETVDLLLSLRFCVFLRDVAPVVVHCYRWCPNSEGFLPTVLMLSCGQTITQTGCQKAFADSFLAWAEMTVLNNSHDFTRTASTAACNDGYIGLSHPWLTIYFLLCSFHQTNVWVEGVFKIFDRPSIAGSTPCIACFCHCTLKHSALMNFALDCPYMSMSTPEHAADDADFYT